MSARKLATALALVCAFGVIAALIAFADKHEESKPEAASHEAQHIMLTPEELKWMPAPPSLPPGAEGAVLEGDPMKPGLFTLRLKLPANYGVRPHWHPADEHVTVLQGSFWMAAGDKFDQSKGKQLKVSGFAVMPAKFHHYAWAGDEGAIIQLHGIGPWALNYLDPNDDPRNKKASK